MRQDRTKVTFVTIEDQQEVVDALSTVPIQRAWMTLKGYYALSLTCLENTYRSFFAYLFYFTDVIDIVYFIIECNCKQTI